MTAPRGDASHAFMKRLTRTRSNCWGLAAIEGSVDRLLDMIRQVDLMLASNVTIDYGPYQPQIAAQLKSLFETAYLCNMLTTPEPVELLRSREQALEAALKVAKEEYAELQAERDQLAFDSVRPMWKPEPPPEEPPPPAPKPSTPPPAPEAGESHHVQPRSWPRCASKSSKEKQHNSDPGTGGGGRISWRA
jgi:hypothetical protein